MNRILNHYVSFACATHPTPANNNDFFSFNDWEQLESDSDYNLSANDALENATVFSDTKHDQSQDEFSFSLSQGQGALHLCVTAQEVLEIGNNLTIDSSDIAMFSFQDKGWVELEQDSKSSGELHYRTYLHDTGAIVKISSRIQIIHADTAGHLN